MLLGGGVAVFAFALYLAVTSASVTSVDIVILTLIATPGGIAGFLGAGLLFFNCGAYLRIEGQHLSARYHWGSRLECDLSEISDVAYRGMQLTLTVDGKRREIDGLTNADELCSYLCSHLTLSHQDIEAVPPATLFVTARRWRQCQTKFLRTLILTTPLQPGNVLRVYTWPNCVLRLAIYSLPGSQEVYHTLEVAMPTGEPVKQMTSEL